LNYKIVFSATGSIQNSVLHFGGFDTTSHSFGLNFTIYDILPNYIGSYTLNNYSNAIYSIPFDPSVQIQVYYSTDSIYTGVLNITTYNTIYQTITGTFSFASYIDDKPPYWGGDTIINVTNGAFIIKF
jgi:hypothetical protein